MLVMREQGYPREETRPPSESLYKDEQMEILDGVPDEDETTGMVDSTNRLLDYEKIRIIGVRAQQIRQVLHASWLLLSAFLGQVQPLQGSPLLNDAAAWVPLFF